MALLCMYAGHACKATSNVLACCKDLARRHREHLRMPPCRTDKLEALGEAGMVLGFARAQAEKRAAHLTHPLLCLDAIRAGVEHGGLKGLEAVGPTTFTRVKLHALRREGSVSSALFLGSLQACKELIRGDC